MTISPVNSKANQEIIPLVRGDIFDGNPDARFALGVFDGREVVADNTSPLVKAYLQLRANVYIDQIHVLEDEHRRVDGTEIDEDDERSTHFVVFENLLGQLAVFGCMRLIEKSPENPSELPIETFYPEAFTEPVPEGGIEVSRFIVRHDESRQRGLSKLNLIRTGLAHTLSNDLGPVYATIEREFERDLRSVGIPTQKVTDSKFIDEYNTVNYGIEIDKYSLQKAVGEDAVTDMTIDKGHVGGYWGTFDLEEPVEELA